jgi:hypothetical protein
MKSPAGGAGPRKRKRGREEETGKEGYAIGSRGRRAEAAYQTTAPVTPKAKPLFR